MKCIFIIGMSIYTFFVTLPGKLRHMFILHSFERKKILTKCKRILQPIHVHVLYLFRVDEKLDFQFILLTFEMTEKTNSIQSHKSYRKNKSESGRTRTSEYIRGGIRCHGE
jgi:hypothetical protein